MTDFIFLGSKITADGDCSHEIKRRLLLGRKAVTNLDNILKSRDIILPTKVRLVKAMVFPVVMNGRWELDHKEVMPKNWCFWIVVWRRLLRVPWTTRKSVLNIHWKDWCWSWNFNTLATWCKELTHWKRLWCWERLKAGEKKMMEDEMVEWHHQLYGHEFEQAPGVSDGQDGLVCCSPWGHKESDTAEQLNWTDASVINESSWLVHELGVIGCLVSQQRCGLGREEVQVWWGGFSELQVMGKINHARR